MAKYRVEAVVHTDSQLRAMELLEHHPTELFTDVIASEIREGEELRRLALTKVELDTLVQIVAAGLGAIEDDDLAKSHGWEPEWVAAIEPTVTKVKAAVKVIGTSQ